MCSGMTAVHRNKTSPLGLKRACDWIADSPYKNNQQCLDQLDYIEDVRLLHLVSVCIPACKALTLASQLACACGAHGIKTVV